LVESVGVKTTECVEFPTGGTVEGEENANEPVTVVPFTLATPPAIVAFDKDWPKLMPEATGRVVMAGVAD
jgi:hypothetical protein